MPLAMPRFLSLRDMIDIEEYDVRWGECGSKVQIGLFMSVSKSGAHWGVAL